MPSATQPISHQKLLVLGQICVAVVAGAIFLLLYVRLASEEKRVRLVAKQEMVRVAESRDWAEWKSYEVRLEAHGIGSHWSQESAVTLDSGITIVRSNLQAGPDLSIRTEQHAGSEEGERDRILTLSCGFRNVSTRLTPADRKEAVGQEIPIKCGDREWRMTVARAVQ